MSGIKCDLVIGLVTVRESKIVVQALNLYLKTRKLISKKINIHFLWGGLGHNSKAILLNWHSAIDQKFLKLKFKITVYNKICYLQVRKD